MADVVGIAVVAELRRLVLVYLCVLRINRRTGFFGEFDRIHVEWIRRLQNRVLSVEIACHTFF